MLLFSLFSISLSTTFIVEAHDSEGKSIRFASAETKDNSHLVHMNSLVPENYDVSGIESFSITRDDGEIFIRKRPEKTNSFAFSFYVIDNILVSFDVKKGTRRGIQGSLNRPHRLSSNTNGFNEQNSQQQQQQEEQPSFVSMIRKYWYIPMMFLAFNICMQGQQQAVQQGQPQAKD